MKIMVEQETFLIPEDESVEFKTASQGRIPSDIWEAVTAFANAEGGTIYFGITPDGKKQPLSVHEIDSIQRDIVTSNAGYSHKVNFAINHKNGVISVYVPPAPAALRPVYSLKRGIPKGAKVRVGSANVQVDDEWMRRFSIAAQGGAESTIYEDVDFDEVLDRNSIEFYIDRVNKRRQNVYQSYSLEEVSRKLRILDKNRQVTLFGLLAFSKDAYLQDIVSPTVSVVVTQYSGSSKVGDNGNDTYLDNREFIGPVKKQFEDALSFIMSKVPIKGKVGGRGLRTDEYSIPEIVLREALANTIAHRDYSVFSSRVQVDIYQDRIEFSNPGRSLVPIEDLENTPSVTRNPLLMNYLKEVGVTEQLARGIRTIKHELRSAGLQEPRFENVGNSFIATIYHSAFIPRIDRDWLNQFSRMPLNERQRTSLLKLKHASSENGLNNKEYRDFNGMNRIGDDQAANRDLRKLVALGIMYKLGDNRASRYYIVEKYL
jgi:ATP-dependent DNA helicase RecG